MRELDVGKELGLGLGLGFGMAEGDDCTGCLCGCWDCFLDKRLFGKTDACLTFVCALGFGSSIVLDLDEFFLGAAAGSLLGRGEEEGGTGVLLVIVEAEFALGLGARALFVLPGGGISLFGDDDAPGAPERFWFCALGVGAD